jgi:hypothetical protein
MKVEAENHIPMRFRMLFSDSKGLDPVPLNLILEEQEPTAALIRVDLVLTEKRA